MDITPTFLIKTRTGSTYTKGDLNSFPLGAQDARLESVESEGNFVVLTYTGGLAVGIPESRVEYVAEIDS